MREDFFLAHVRREDANKLRQMQFEGLSVRIGKVDANGWVEVIFVGTQSALGKLTRAIFNSGSHPKNNLL